MKRKELFEVKKTEYTTRNFRIPVELLERLNTVAQREGISVNKLVVQCCEYALDNLNDSTETEFS